MNLALLLESTVTDVIVVLCCILLKWLAAVFPVKKKKGKGEKTLLPEACWQEGG